MNDSVDLKRLYQLALLRRGTSPRPDLPVDVVHQLASGGYSGPDRLALLDRVLADPGLAAELDFFSELASAQSHPGRPREGRPLQPAGPWPRRLLALAATIAVVASTTLLWRASRPAPPDVVRGDGTTVTLVLPAPAFAPGAALAWRPVEGAASYRLEVIDAAGHSVIAAAPAETVFVVPADAVLTPGASYSWWVTAVLADGRTVRSAAATVRAP